MKLIQVTEAAERLGVSRQTLENWGKNGTLKIHKTGKPGNAHWVDADTIEALADTIQDVEKARQKLQQEQEQLRADYRKEHELRRDIERELFMVSKFKTAAYAGEFYMSIPKMLDEIGLLNQREAQIMCHIINGQDLGWIAEEYGLTRARVTQIFYKGCRKARELSTIKQQLDELESLRVEVANMRQEMKVMSKDLKVQQIAEQELLEMEEAERIEYIKKTDHLLILLGTRLVDCDISVRSLNCVKSLDIKTIGDLARAQKTDLLKLRNFGRRSLSELDDFLNSKGLTFGMDVEKIYRDRIAQRLQEIYTEIMQNLQEQLRAVAKEYARQFGAIIGMELEHFVGDEPTDIACFGDCYFFTLQEMKQVVDNIDKYARRYGSKEAVGDEVRNWVDWYLNGIDHDRQLTEVIMPRVTHQLRPNINLRAWLDGCPREDTHPWNGPDADYLRLQNDKATLERLIREWSVDDTLIHVLYDINYQLDQAKKEKEQRDHKLREAIMQGKAGMEFQQTIK